MNDCYNEVEVYLKNHANISTMVILVFTNDFLYKFCISNLIDVYPTEIQRLDLIDKIDFHALLCPLLKLSKDLFSKN